MKTLLLPSLGATSTVTVIGKARTSNDRQGMLCLCECGQQNVPVATLLSGRTKWSGCLRRPVIDLMRLNPGEIPLHGKKAAGRVALVDDEDYGLLMQYRWHVKESFDSEGRRTGGPYARTNIYLGDRRTVSLFMHQLLTGFAETDHRDGDGLNNQRSNLRPATSGQNNVNRPKQSGGCSSQFKGVSWHRRRRKWQAYAQVNGRIKYLGCFDDETEAARVRDAAALEAWGEFARPQLPRMNLAAFNPRRGQSRGRCPYNCAISLNAAMFAGLFSSRQF